MHGIQTDRIEWSVDTIALLTKMWAAGLSSMEIAEKIPNATRSAIMGKIVRLKLPTPAGKVARKLQSYRGAPAKPFSPGLDPPAAAPAAPARLRNGYDPALRRNPSHNILAKIAIAGTEPGLPSHMDEPVVGEGIQLLQLTNSTCRWPSGHPGGDRFFFCGAAGADMNNRQPYCAFHMRKATDKTSIRSPKAFEQSAIHAAN